MPAIDNRDLVVELGDLLKPFHEDHWKDLEGNRRVTYIPFSKAEDTLTAEQKAEGNTTLRKLAERDQMKQALRSFAKEVQKEMRKTNEGFQVTQENLMKAYTELAVADKTVGEKILKTTARKTPVIIQHGEAAEKRHLAIRPTDSVNVTGHGSRTWAKICTEPADGPSLDAQEVVRRMVADLKNGQAEGLDPALENNLGKIKLDSCGSAGTFLAEFTREARHQRLAPSLDIHGYGQDSLRFNHLDFALDHLDEGTRLVSTAANDAMTDEVWKTTSLAEDIKAKAEQLNLGDRKLDALKAKVDKEIHKVNPVAGMAEDIQAVFVLEDEAKEKLAELESLKTDVETLQGRLKTDPDGHKRKLFNLKAELAELNETLEDNPLMYYPEAEVVEMRANASRLERSVQSLEKQLAREEMTCSELVADLETEKMELNFSTTERASLKRATLTVRQELEAGKVQSRAPNVQDNSLAIKDSKAAPAFRNG